MPPACSLPPAGGSRGNSAGRLPALALVLVLLLDGCAATSSRTADDLTTTTQVKIALLGDARVGGQRLEVSTHQGVVTLSGTVRTAADERQAIALARAVRGVRAVTSVLEIQE